MELQLSCSSNNAEASLTYICVNLHYMTPRAAAKLIRESKEMLVTTAWA